MKKEELITFIIVGIIIIGEIISQKYTQKCVEEFKERLYDLKASALSEELSKEEIAQTTNSIYEDWNNKSKTLSFYLEHDELEKVHTQMRRVIAYFEVDSKEDAIPELEEGIYTLEHLKDKRELTWKNVF